MNPRAPRIALVGRRLDHNENLGLAYLRAALLNAGIEVTTHYVNDAAELARAVARILQAPPDVVGLSLADGGSALWPLSVGEAIHQAGYRGHVVAGGQFATLARAWLLERYSWLASVVRFAGEAAIVEIVERVMRAESVAGVAGVTTREGDGKAASVLDPTPMRIRPMRDELPEILGHPAAHMAASRGCLGRCQYCGPAALHTLERREGVRAGIASQLLTESGVGGVRRREIAAIADEMAELWHERGVRYFYFVDEHLLPYDENEALEYLAQWKAALARHDVGAFGIGTMLRADRISSAIVRAFADLGLVRVFVGLELATEVEGRRFGRRAPADRELALLDDFARAGVITVSNLMLVNPYSTPETISAGIDLLERVPSGVFEATRMMVYHGTRLMKTMTEEGRLLGNPFRYGYSFEDSAVERFAEIFTRLRAQAFYDYSVAFRTHDAFLALALARRLHPNRVDREVTARLDATRRRVNRLYVRAYRQGLDLALSGGGFEAAASLVTRFRPEVAKLELELDAIEHRLERELAHVTPRRARPLAPMRSAAAGVLSFALLGCGGETKNAAAPETKPPRQNLENTPVPSEPESIPDAGPIDDRALEPADAAAPSGVCAPSEREAVERNARQLLEQKATCFSGSVVLSDPPAVDFQISARRICNVSGTAHVVAAEKALAGAQLQSCKDENGRPLTISVEGKAQREAAAAMAAVGSCVNMNAPNVLVVLDAKGRVVRVNGAGGTTYAKCIKRVLSGLTFPCLASFEVCPEHVIIE